MFDMKSELLRLASLCITNDTLSAVHSYLLFIIYLSCASLFHVRPKQLSYSFTKDIFLSSVYLGTYPVPLVESWCQFLRQAQTQIR